MGAASMSTAQWLFPISAIVHQTPSRTTSAIPVEKELYDRARGVEFLFRLGVSLLLPLSPLFTAATWFHRFYMRHSMEDYHRQDVAAACIFLATKTEECGRKLKDVARTYCTKVSKKKAEEIADNSPELEESQAAILLTEEVLLEALCFDFVVRSPHADLIDLFDAQPSAPEFEDYAFTIAHDSYRTPLCVLYPSRIIAVACYVLAQQYVEGNTSLSLAARLASPAPSASLPTPPSQKPAYSKSSRFAIDFYNFNEMELASVADALSILLEFYEAQDLTAMEHLATLAAIPPPNTSSSRPRMYQSFADLAQGTQRPPEPNGESTPLLQSQSKESPMSKSTARGWIPVTTASPEKSSEPPNHD